MRPSKWPEESSLLIWARSPRDWHLAVAWSPNLELVQEFFHGGEIRDANQHDVRALAKSVVDVVADSRSVQQRLDDCDVSVT